jgi:outer membrane protein TolC
MRKQILRAFFLCLIFSTFIPGVSYGEPEGYQPLESLISEVIARNPELKNLGAEKQAKAHLVSPAGTLPDPKIGFGITNMRVDDFDLGREAMTSKDIFLIQSFPFPGKLSLKEEIASLSSKSAGMSVRELENLLKYKTRKAYYAYFEVYRSINITEKTKLVLKQFLEITRQRYSVGRALQQDIFKAQTAILNVQRRLFDLEKMRVKVLALINTLRSRPVDLSLEAPSRLPVEDVPFSQEDLVNGAVKYNPTLGKIKISIDKADRKANLSRRNLYPDFALSARYRQRETRSDFLTGAVTLTIPLYAGSKQKENIESSEYFLKSRERKYDSYLNTIKYEIRSINAELNSLNKKITLLKGGILPEAREAVNSSMSAYTVGKVEFISLLTSELDLFRYELELAKLVNRYNERKARLWNVVGTKLPAREVSDENK